MAWIVLTPETLLTRLADAEYDAVSFAATANPKVLAEIAAQIAAEWRGKLARVTKLSKRPTAVPDELLTHILADFRYRAYTRLPGMASLLDELRVNEWHRANKVGDNLDGIVIAPPDDPVEDSGGTPTPRWSKQQLFND